MSRLVCLPLRIVLPQRLDDRLRQHREKFVLQIAYRATAPERASKAAAERADQVDGRPRNRDCFCWRSKDAASGKACAEPRRASQRRSDIAAR